MVWHTSSSRGGNPDNSSVRRIVNEKTVRRYPEETGGTFILVFPGRANKVLGAGSTSNKSNWSFLNEVLGVKSGKGLAQRFQPGTVTASDGTKFTVGKGSGGVETQFSALEPGRRIRGVYLRAGGARHRRSTGAGGHALGLWSRPHRVCRLHAR